MSEYIKVIDYETSIKCPIGNNKAHPMWPANKVVLYGVTVLPARVRAIPHVYEKVMWPGAIKETALLVGHNIKFDALYTFRDNDLPIPLLWDTQLAEYLLTGQESKYATLDELTIKYVGKEAVKDSEVKKFWDKGVDTEDIPRSILEPYLVGDVTNTSIIFQKQWAICEERGILPWVLTQMDALRATTYMARVGMCVDWEYVKRQRVHYRLVLEDSVKVAQDDLGDYQWSSNKDLSLYFFGGTIKKKEKVADGFYKNGNPKFKTVEVEHHIDGHVPWNPGTLPGASGYYSVDETTLESIASSTTCAPNVRRVAGHVLAARKAQKIANTYYDGLLDLRFPNNFIYPNLKHCQTTTGRLSSSQPNLQNQTTEGDVKRAYISRWGDDGVILELDYSQLEVVWLAYLSGDEQLIDDINNGRDMHVELFRSMYGRVPTKDERRTFKRRSFALVYGAGAKGIAEQTGISVAEAREFINTFYERYKGVRKWHVALQRGASAASTVFYKPDESMPHRKYIMEMPWGRTYSFVTYKNDWSSEPTFSPTELKNYPVQGSATGDMVPMMVGILQRKLEEAGHWEKQNAFLINTVHDSVLLDVKKEVLYDVARLCKKTLEDAPIYLKQHLSIDFPCKLSVGVEAGPNWQDVQPLEI